MGSVNFLVDDGACFGNEDTFGTYNSCVEVYVNAPLIICGKKFGIDESENTLYSFAKAKYYPSALHCAIGVSTGPTF